MYCSASQRICPFARCPPPIADPADGRRDVLGANLGLLDRLANAFDDGARVEEGALHDRLGGHRGHTQVRELELLAAAAARQLDGLDRRRADVESDDDVFDLP